MCVATPADAALMMQLGMDGVFVGSGIFKSGDPFKRAQAIVHAVSDHSHHELQARARTQAHEYTLVSSMFLLRCQVLASYPVSFPIVRMPHALTARP